MADQYAGHENARQETSSEAANVWGWIDWVVCYDSRNVEDQSRMGLIHRLERHYLLQRLVRLPRQRRHRQQLQTTAVRCVWSDNETASHLSRVATRVSVPLASTESSLWTPAARFVARRSRWWCVSITETVATIMNSVDYNWHWLDSVPLFVICVFWINYPRVAMQARVIAIATYPSVCPSRAGIVSKRRKLAAWFLHLLVAPRL